MIYTLIGIFLCASMASCTYSINLAHTEGHASDTIDDTDTNTPKVDPNINLTGLPL